MPYDVPQTELAPAQATEAVLNHLARYRLTVFAALERLPVFSAAGPRQIKNVLRDCQRQSLVGSAPLHHGAKYWYVDTAGAERCGLSELRIGPLSEPAKLRALALLRFCCLSDKPRHRLTPDDLSRHFPSLYRPGLPSGYYFDPAGSGRLGLARIDAGRRGRWDRVLQSLRADINDHVHKPGFQRFIEAGRFEITVLTVFRQKARRIHESLAQVADAHRIPLQVVALPELLPLIGSGRERRCFDHSYFFDSPPWVSTLLALEHGKTTGNRP